MESVTNHVASPDLTSPQIKSSDLFTLFDKYNNQIKVLSLDCFDTLIWRKTATPSDVFYDLQSRPAFKSIGMSATLRSQAEEAARQKQFLITGSTEVKLADIYAAGFPELSAYQLAALADDELACEMDACYGFPPVIELIREANSRGIKIVIVSDTYFDENQLHLLLQHILPRDIMPMISKIFCSSEYGKNKTSGLLKIMAEQMQHSPREILHLGDNGYADFIAPQSAGMHAKQLVHFDNALGDLIRTHALALGFVDSTTRHSRSLAMPYKGILAASATKFENPESIIGYSSLGPIMHAFGRFIYSEIAQLKRTGKNPKVIFLMRDAFLPSLACETIAGEEIGKRVRISRFAAYASSFRTKADVDKYLGENVTSLRFFDMCQQLLIPKAMAEQIIKNAIKATHPALAFLKGVQEEEVLAAIFQESKKYRKKLIRHLENEIHLKAGDTLMFVDLGYSGTAQNKLEPVFREEIDVDVIGRYLLVLRTPNWQESRKGLLDPSWCDDRTLHTLVSYIALVEQLCTANEKSVVDYDDNGEPIYSTASLSKQQHNKLDLIQAECLRFVRDAETFFSKSYIQPSMHAMRDAALGELTRLLFIPSANELDYLRSFQFDLNLGTQEILNVFDEKKGMDGLRKRGLFFMEKNLKSMRTNYPAELRYAGLELGLTLLAQNRFGFDLRVNDLSLRREKIRIIAIRGGNSSTTTLDALPTHDGYFSVHIPIGNGDFQIAVQFGMNYKWVQLESADIIATSTLYGSKESEATEDATTDLAVDQMEDKGNGLFECTSENSLLVYAPNRKFKDMNYTLRIIFRPIAMR